MSKGLVKYVALAACAYILVYIGMHIFDAVPTDALAMLAALAAIGTLLAGHRQGPALCVGAGGMALIFGVIKLVTDLKAPDLAFTGSYVAAAMVAIGAGVVLIRLAPPVGDEPTI